MTASPFVISKDRINRLPLEQFAPLLRTPGYLLDGPGREHYRLLAYLSTWFEGATLFDVGTSEGHSAVALSWNRANRVISLDVVNRRAVVSEADLSNVEFRVGDCTGQVELLGSSLVFLDTSPHYGDYEKKVYDHLVAGGFRGLLLLDDIAAQQFPGMSQFWDTIDLPKADLTPYGHHSGTGLVNFGGFPVVVE